MTDRAMDEHTPLLEQQQGPGKIDTWQDLKGYVKPLLSANYILLCAGMNDGSLGIIIPQLKEHYGITDSVVSRLFLCCAFGFFSAAMANGYLVHKLGQKGTMYAGGTAIVFAYLVLMQGVAFEIMCFAMVFIGSGYGVLDGGVNVYMANVPMATMNLNIGHAMYGLGAMISPLVGTYLMAHQVAWKGMYMFLFIVATLDLIAMLIIFWKVDVEGTHDDDEAMDASSTDVSDASDSPDVRKPAAAQKSLTRRAIVNRMTLLGAAYILVYAGVEVCIGGWAYTYLKDGRHGDRIAMGRVVSGYWAGLCIGRLILGWVAGKLGEKRAVTIFTICASALILAIYLVPIIAVDAVCLWLIGFSIGPFFPCCVSLASKVLPRKMQPTAIGFMAAFGAGGAAFFPFISGQMAGVLGIQYMPLSWLTCAILMQVIWTFVPNGSKKLDL